MILSSTRPLPALVLSLGLAACAAPSGTASASSRGAESLNDDGGAILLPTGDGGAAPPDPGEPACEVAQAFDAVIGAGPCANVMTLHGTWEATPLFAGVPDTPRAVRDTFCSFRFRPSNDTAASCSDRHGLEVAAGAQLLSKDTSLPGASPFGADACGDGAGCTGSATLIPAVDPRLGPGVFGVAGCDVCARVEDTRLFAVIPAEKDLVRQVNVALTDGTSRAFQLMPSPGARAIVATLPPLAPGISYVPSVVAVW